MFSKIIFPFRGTDIGVVEGCTDKHLELCAVKGLMQAILPLD